MGIWKRFVGGSAAAAAKLAAFPRPAPQSSLFCEPLFLIRQSAYEGRLEIRQKVVLVHYSRYWGLRELEGKPKMVARRRFTSDACLYLVHSFFSEAF